MTNYSFSGRRRPIDSEILLMTDFVNLNIKSTQYFRGAIHVYVFSAHMCMNICICTMLLKNNTERACAILFFATPN
jgi:hypothetical protein